MRAPDVAPDALAPMSVIVIPREGRARGVFSLYAPERVLGSGADDNENEDN